ncbi:hypothetical protein M378DRAFT_903891 [Amanita muscaria Koide BX008]|uniref:Uncharacterized protein n=1 Tax=Amanita muscaria (strain Koide BX008) TaxID=946122 RepID=A0A0C2WX40_AMAMK|nr:hypothetical protein M378DRAFT_903891 [Amanita muscaria Koide BX008]
MLCLFSTTNAFRKAGNVAARPARIYYFHTRLLGLNMRACPRTWVELARGGWGGAAGGVKTGLEGSTSWIGCGSIVLLLPLAIRCPGVGDR